MGKVRSSQRRRAPPRSLRSALLRFPSAVVPHIRSALPKLDPAVLLDRYLLECVRLALKAAKLRRAPSVPANKESRWPEHDDRHASNDAILGGLTILYARNFGGAS